mgnify:CR=1 FL=1
MSKIIVLYDSWCPLCVSMKENIQRLNWLRLIEFQTIRDDSRIINIPIQKLEKEMHCIKINNGKIATGIDAIASIIARIPLLTIFYIPIKLSSYFGFGHYVYNYIASTRKIVPIGNCSEETCDIKNIL